MDSGAFATSVTMYIFDPDLLARLALLQIIALAGLHGLVVWFVALDRLFAVVKVCLALAHDLGDVATHDQRCRLVDADAEYLGIGFDECGHVREAFALGEVLVDGDAGQEAETALVTLAHHFEVAQRTATT